MIISFFVLYSFDEGGLIMTENYYFKEVLLGLKSEYNEYENMIKKIKEYVKVIGKEKLESFDFYLENSIYGLCLICKIEEKRNRIMKLLGKSNIDYVSASIRSNGSMYVKSNDICLYGDSLFFQENIKKLMNSSFAKEMIVLFVNSLDGNSCLRVEYNSIKCNLGRGNYLVYNPITNSITLHSRNKVTRTGLYDILYKSYLRNDFPLYHQDIIDSSLEKSKAIEIISDPVKKAGSFETYEDMEFIEEGKRLILKNKNRR